MEKKDLAVVTQTTDTQTKMMFVEGKNMPLRLHPKYEPHQPTPSIPAGNKQGLYISLNLALQKLATFLLLLTKLVLEQQRKFLFKTN